MTKESILEWASGWLREDTADDPTFRQRFLDGLEEELSARDGAIHLLCDGILAEPSSPPSLIRRAHDARDMIQPAEVSGTSK